MIHVTSKASRGLFPLQSADIVLSDTYLSYSSYQIAAQLKAAVKPTLSFPYLTIKV